MVIVMLDRRAAHLDGSTVDVDGKRSCELASLWIWLSQLESQTRSLRPITPNRSFSLQAPDRNTKKPKHQKTETPKNQITKKPNHQKNHPWLSLDKVLHLQPN